MVQSIEDSSFYNISNRIILKRSQASILYIKFLVFFAGRQYMKTRPRVSIKVQRTIGTLSRISIENFNHLWLYFFEIRSSLIFFAEGHGVVFVVSVRIQRKYHISMYFLRKIIFHFPSREKMSCSRGEKYHLSS